VLDAQASAWLQSIIIPGSMALHLQQVDDITRRFRLKNDGARVVVTADNAAAIHQEANKPKINALDVEIESLRLSLRVDEQRRTELANGNLAQQQKESVLERLDESLKSRQQRLSALENERRALAPEISKSAGLPSGAYSLFAGLRRLCEIKIKGTN
jgi:septal ring factor EnvC (AmiA/AmiB activator)